MRNVILAFIILIASQFNLVSAQLMINEISARNETAVAPDGNVHDWIEILNISDLAIQLSDFYLSDNPEEPQKWQLPHHVLSPGEFKVIYASGQENEGDEWHAPFKLGAGEETILLSHGSDVLQQMNCLYLDADHTQGAFPDGGSTQVGYSYGTPGTQNNLPLAYIPSAPASINISHESGAYPADFELTAHTTHPGSVIRFTTDGSMPVSSSPVWTGTIEIRDESSSPMMNALIPTTDSWVPPLSNIRKATVVRLACFAGPFRTSHIHNATYFIDPSFNQRYSVPVVSIQTDSENFFSDENGIYVAGNAPYGNFVHKGPSWERHATIQHFAADGSLMFETDCGVRIHGRSSRFYPQKSLRVYFHNEKPDAELIFNDELNPEPQLMHGLILRSPDRLFTRALFTDALVQQLGMNLDVDAQKQRPVVVFINGEYWGIHLLSERVDEHFTSDKVNADPSEIRLIEWDDDYIGEPDDVFELQQDIEWIRQADGQDAAGYEMLQNKIDIENLIDYACIQLVVANEDFPNNNLKIWRAGTEMPWRFILYDGDACLRDYESDLLDRLLNDPSLDEPFTVMFRSCMKNVQFSAMFVNRLNNLMSDPLSTGNMVSSIDHFKTMYEPLVGEHINRWAHPDHVGEWLSAVDDMLDFALSRAGVLHDDVMNELPSPIQLYPNPAHTVLNVDMPITDDIPSVQIQNMNGLKLPADYELTESGMRFNLDNLDSGLYYLSVDLYHIRHTQRFLVVK